MKCLPMVLMIAVSLVFSSETAITQSGKKVLLKNDGTWELFDPSRHSNMSDVREQAGLVQISLKYKDYNWCVKEKRMMLEADEVPESKILDSLKAVPKGGLLFVQMPTSLLIKNDPRTFQIKVRDNKGRQLAKADLNEGRAQEADEAGLSNLGVLSLPSFSKGDLAILIEEMGTRQVFEYTIGMNQE